MELITNFDWGDDQDGSRQLRAAGGS